MSFERLNKQIGALYRRLIKKPINKGPLRFNTTHISNKAQIICSKALVLGQDVKILDNAHINASGGVLVGPKVVIGQNSKVDTNAKNYKSVIVLRDLAKGEVVENASVIAQDINHKLSVAKNELVNIDCVFILSTGRSGSKSIAYTLDHHTEIDAFHEPLRHFSELSKQKEEQSLNQLEWNERLVLTLHTFLSCIENKLVVISDQKFGNLVADLNKLMPKSKFVWLVRDPLKNITSTVRRGWFSDAEMGFSKDEVLVSDPYYPEHRVNAYKNGQLPILEWRSMSMVQRNIWYYKYWNELIEDQLKFIDRKKWKKIRLEELEDEIGDILSFCGVQQLKLDVQHINNAKHKKVKDSLVAEIKLEIERIRFEF